MLDDIKQTPDALKKLLKAYISDGKDVSNIELPISPGKIEKIYIVASGSSRNAANTAKYTIEMVTAIPVIVDFAGEFANREVAASQNDLLIALSQSGETVDVLTALKTARQRNIPTFAITNNPNSSIYKLACSAMFIHAGMEKSIPATKTFTNQLMSLYILGIFLAEQLKSFPQQDLGEIKKKLHKIPDKISDKIEFFSGEASKVAEKIKEMPGLIILGRSQNWPLAEEGALKIQETSYKNAFGYPTGEFMHGHLALLDENFPVISILTEVFDGAGINILAKKNTLKIKEKRNPLLIAIGHYDSDIEKKADIFIKIEQIDRVTAPFLTAVLLQVLAYKLADLLGFDAKSPRSLTKTVKTE